MCLFAQFHPVWFLLLAGAALAVAFLLIRFHGYWSRRIERPSITESVGASPASPVRREAPSAQGRHEVDLHEMARELSARLDSKMSVLQHLIRDAEGAAARLQATLEKSLPAGERKGPNDSGVLLESGARSPRRHEEIYALAARGLSAAEIAQRTGLPAGEVELILSLRNRK